VYEFKEQKIAKVYISFLGLKNNTAKRILEWKNPNSSKKSDSTIFSDIIYEILKERGWRETGKLEVTDINQFLDELSNKEGFDSITFY
jgi:hypothetical protein